MTIPITIPVSIYLSKLLGNKGRNRKLLEFFVFLVSERAAEKRVEGEIIGLGVGNGLPMK